MAVEEEVAGIRGVVAAARQRSARIGFVPTMGALHAGHISLVEEARQECDFVVVSIFVNPTQFGPQEDFSRYPRDLERDLEACRQAGVDAVFYPAVETIYAEPYFTFVEVSRLSEILEGRVRPGHFRGVATVVLKLFNIVAPDVACFGQKDYQQQTIIRRMCAELNLPVSIRVCPTLRESDGLALSSRNVYLNAGERQSALALWRSLNLARELIEAGERDVAAIRARMRDCLASTEFVEPDYATLIHPDTLAELTELETVQTAVIAARVGRTRLIDNLIIRAPAPCDRS